MSIVAEGKEPVVRLLRAIDAKCAGLAQQLHAGWHAGLPAEWWQGGPQPGRASRLARASHALARLYGVRWPDLAALQPRLHRVAVLERGPLVRLLVLAALHTQRFEVRQIVSKSERQRLCAMVGEQTYDVLVQSADNGLPARAGSTPARMELGELAEAGCRAIAAAGLWRCRHVLTLVRLALPPGALSAPPRAERPLRGPLAGFEERLHLYFPEFAWLFGSEMDRALSVSKTA